MKYILKVILIILLIMLVAGLLFGFVFKDKNIDDKKTNILDFANEWSLTAGTGDSALTINQDTKSIIIDNMSLPGKGGDITEFKCNDKTFADKIRISFSVNDIVWNAQNIGTMELHGDLFNKCYNFHEYTLFDNLFSNYYNSNKDTLNLKSGDCIATMLIEISFIMPESLQIYEDMYAGNLNMIEYVELSNYVYSVNIPILIK